MSPVFRPGDQKVFRSPIEPRYPRLVNLAYLVLLMAGVGIGLLFIAAGAYVAGIPLTVLGVVLSALILKGEIAEILMVRRMRKRQRDESPRDP